MSEQSRMDGGDGADVDIFSLISWLEDPMQNFERLSNYCE
jgi:hypothetical protein